MLFCWQSWLPVELPEAKQDVAVVAQTIADISTGAASKYKQAVAQPEPVEVKLVAAT